MAGLFIDERLCDDHNISPLLAQKRVDLIKECSALIVSLKARFHGALFHYTGVPSVSTGAQIT